jgi:hypothetical protein
MVNMEVLSLAVRHRIRRVKLYVGCVVKVVTCPPLVGMGIPLNVTNVEALGTRPNPAGIRGAARKGGPLSMVPPGQV